MNSPQAHLSRPPIAQSVPQYPGRWYALHTSSGSERTVAGQLEAWIEGEVFVPVCFSSDPGTPSLLFTNYIFVKADLTESLQTAVSRLEPVRGWVGTSPGQPSSIPDWEIAFLKYLGTLTRHPMLGEVPVAGATVEVTQGPLRGVRGLVASIRNQNARLAVTVSTIGKSFDVVVPLAHLASLNQSQIEVSMLPAKSKHRRGGKRMKRHLKNVEAR